MRRLGFILVITAFVNCGGAGTDQTEATSSVAQSATDGDNGSSPGCQTQSAWSYPNDSVWSPDNSLLSCACITTSGLLGTLTSACNITLDTCGYLFCLPANGCPDPFQTYQYDRVWDPANSLLGCGCITTGYHFGIMTSKCTANPRTCGNLYCVSRSN